MINFQDNLKSFFDVDTWQANFNKMYDVDAMQESMKKFYDVEAFQENVKNLYNLENIQGNLSKFMDQEALKAWQESAESLVDQELVQKNTKLASNLVATNVNAAADAVILQSVALREAVEDALKQADVLASSKDLDTAVQAQKEYMQAQQEVLLENLWNKAGLVAGLVESNINLLKEAFAQAPTKTKPAAKAQPTTKVQPASQTA